MNLNRIPRAAAAAKARAAFLTWSDRDTSPADSVLALGTIAALAAYGGDRITAAAAAELVAETVAFVYGSARPKANRRPTCRFWGCLPVKHAEGAKLACAAAPTAYRAAYRAAYRD